MNPIPRIDSLNSHSADGHPASGRREPADEGRGGVTRPLYAGRSPRARWWALRWGVSLLAVLVGLFLVGWLPRLQNTQALDAAAVAKAAQTPIVPTAAATRARRRRSGSCPATACRCTRRRCSPAPPAT